MKTQVQLLGDVFNISATKKDRVNNWGGDCYKIKVNNIQFTFTNSQANIGQELSEDDLKFAFRCFIQDAQCVECADFHEFCEEFGYNRYDDFTEGLNKESKKIYNACNRSLKSAGRLTDLDLCDILCELSEQGIE